MPLLLDCVDHVEKGTSVSTAVLGYRSRPETNRSRVRRRSHGHYPCWACYATPGTTSESLSWREHWTCTPARRTGSFGPWLPLGTPCRMRKPNVIAWVLRLFCSGVRRSAPLDSMRRCRCWSDWRSQPENGEPGHPRRRRGAGRSAGSNLCIRCDSANRSARGSRCTAPVPAKCCWRSPATCTRRWLGSVS